MLLHFFQSLAGKGLLAKILTSITILIVAVVAARALRAAISRKSLNPRTNLFRGMLYWGIILTGAFVALESVGYDPGPLLVTGGLVSVAVGLASQTSLSNLIGGLFLAADEPFQVGDYVKVGEHEGVVLSVDPLSTKLRTMQNVFVRIPNEMLLKSVVQNLSRYPIRRMDLSIHVPLGTPLGQVEAAVLEAARADFVLVEPAPFVHVEAMTEVAIRLQLRVWIGEGEVLGARSKLYRAVTDALIARGIRPGAAEGTVVAVAGSGAPPPPANSQKTPR